ncbi:DUF2279 domain-containing protein [Phaeocystidibacter luteus]|uniref:DUF2279 domain-containing protein n=1 Tax=Phaeocystidibacter luteus TaxID=911197 RepID=A0A6N6RM27_9FLAO|nr:DUF2279 domain-containing protein [Phaeocystidibacter luteus]KAB2814674.1 DUF2279 domain-containing protein [Phaeocystidibacter luteus]
MRKIIAISLILCSLGGQAQSFWTPSDTLNKPRLYTLVGVGGGLAIGSLAALYSTWYADYPQSGFHGVNDFGNWRGMDKLGHAMTTYAIGHNSYAALRWSGVSEKEAIWYGGLTGWTYLAAVEVMDGFSDEWGFSTGDFAFNTLGAGLFIGQQLGWGEQRMMLKFSYHPTEFSQYRPELLGNGWTEEWLKDYNGQTYWLSVNPRSFSDSEDGWWPTWLNVAGGYGATGMTGGSTNAMFDPNGNPIPQYTRGSQYYLSLDVDLTKIKVKSDFWKGVFRVVSIIKIPAPTLEYRTSDGNFYFHPIYF